MLKQLRKYLTLCAVAMVGVVMLTACGGDDDDDGKTQDIVGTWITSHQMAWIKENGKIQESWESEVSDDNVEYYKFNKNGKFTCSNKWKEKEGIWELSEGKLTIIYNDNPEVESYNCSIQSNEMTWSFSQKLNDGRNHYEYYGELHLLRTRN